MTEEFRELEEFPRYKIGNRGTILGLRGNPMNPEKDRSTERYYQLRLSVKNKDGICKHRFVHRLVALAWIPNPDNEPEIDHIDRNSSNNCIENLRWCSRIKNANNVGKSILNKSGIAGLSFDKYRNKWKVQKAIMGVKYQKCFKERSEAEAYLKEIIETPRFSTEEALA